MPSPIGTWGKIKIKGPVKGPGPIDEPPIGGGGKPDVEVNPPEPDPPGPLPPIGEDDTFVKRSYSFNKITYDTTIFFDDSDSDPYIYHQSGPTDTEKENLKTLQIRINRGHIFIQKWFKGGFEEDEEEGILRFGVAFVLAQEIAKNNKNKNKARHVLANFEEIIKDPSF